MRLGCHNTSSLKCYARRHQHTWNYFLTHVNKLFVIMVEGLFTTEGIVSLLTLTFLEIVLGIDNVVFISITAGRLPAHQQGTARKTGILLALVVRIGLLLGVSWIIGLKNPIMTFND